MNSFVNSGMLWLTVIFSVFFAGNLYAFDAALVPATEKILPDNKMPVRDTISVKGAQNEWESFQIMIRADKNLTGINLALDNFEGENGEIVSHANIDLYREHYLNVTDESPGSVTYHERGTGLYPDPLIPFWDPYSEIPRPVGAPFDLASGETGAIFVDIHIPEDAVPGEYSATFTLSENAKDTHSFDITLVVWDIKMPVERTIGTAYGFGEDKVRSFHGGPEGEESDDYPEIVRRYRQAMQTHNMDARRINGNIPFEFDEDDNLLPIDWTEYDAAVAPYLDGSYFLSGLPVTRFDIGRFRPGSGTGNFTEQQYIKAAAAFSAHLKEKGWWDKSYTRSTDEPWMNGGNETWDQIIKDIDLLIAADPDWRYKTLVTGPYIEKAGDRIGIWCPVTPMYENWFYTGDSMAGREDYPDRLAKGEKLWFYVCNANYPPYAGYDIDTNIGYEPRMVKWGAWFEHATGFLYWRMTYWVDDDPWNVFLNLENFEDIFARNGDGFLFYPGDHNGTAGGKGSPEWLSIDGPVISYRMKQIRDGFDDWELFQMAEDLGEGDYAREQVARAYTRFGDFMLEICSGSGTYCPDDQPWTLDQNLLLEIRENIALKVQYLLHPDTYPDPEGGSEDGDVDLDIEDQTEELAENEVDEGEISEQVDSDGDIENAVKDDTEDSDSGCNSTSAGNFYLLAFAMLLFVMRRRES